MEKLNVLGISEAYRKADQLQEQINELHCQIEQSMEFNNKVVKKAKEILATISDGKKPLQSHMEESKKGLLILLGEL